MSNQKGFSKISIIIIVLILIGGAYFVFSKKDKSIPAQNTENQNSQSKQSSTRNSTINNWSTYKNDKYGFEFQYPSTWKPVLRYVVVDEEMGGNPWDSALFVLYQINQLSNIPKLGVYGPELTVFVSDFVLEYDNKKVTKDEFVTEVTKSSNFKWIKINNIDALRVEKKVDNKIIEYGIDSSFTFVEYYLFKVDKVYEFKLVHDNNISTPTQDLDQFETVVSTFKFTK